MTLMPGSARRCDCGAQQFGRESLCAVRPTVVLGGAQSAAVHTLLITTMHASALTGLGDPQRDTYTVTHLVGSANNEILPL